jgi:hypothetical protein
MFQQSRREMGARAGHSERETILHMVELKQPKVNLRRGP